MMMLWRFLKKLPYPAFLVPAVTLALYYEAWALQVDQATVSVMVGNVVVTMIAMQLIPHHGFWPETSTRADAKQPNYFWQKFVLAWSWLVQALVITVLLAYPVDVALLRVPAWASASFAVILLLLLVPHWFKPANTGDQIIAGLGLTYTAYLAVLGYLYIYPLFQH